MARRRASERGEISLLTAVLIAAAVAGVYYLYLFGPYYLENNRAERLSRQALKYWLNQDDRLDVVRAKMQRELTQAQVESITAEDVQFELYEKGSGYVYFYYEVVVEHPFIFEPSTLTFEFEYEDHRKMP